MSMEDQNLAMTQMLESFVRRGNKQSIPQQNVAKPKEVQEQIRPSSPSGQSAPPKMGPKSAQQMHRGRANISCYIFVLLFFLQKFDVFYVHSD